MEGKGSINGTEGHIDPLPILVEIGTRALDLIVDVSKDSTSLSSVGWWCGPFESGRCKNVVEEACDGITTSKGCAEGGGGVTVTVCEGIVCGVAVHVGSVQHEIE